MTKQQIINGIVRYIKNTLVMQIPDVWTKRIVAGFADLMAIRPDTFDKVMEKYPIVDMVKDSNGSYDVDVLADLLIRNINEYGNITLNIMGATFTFTASDVSDLREAMR